MKYTDLIQLVEYFKQFEELKKIKRIANNEFLITLDEQNFIFNLDKGRSGIYKGEKLAKNYNAPFDLYLKKQLGRARIKDILVPFNNRILVFVLELRKSYKSYVRKIYFEFTGKHTNVIISDENEKIKEALRYITKSFRRVKLNETLIELKAIEIKEKFEKIEDFEEYFKKENERINNKKLEEYKKNKLQALDKKIKKIDEKILKLKSKNELLKKAASYKRQADILAANLSFIKEYERDFTLLDFDAKPCVFTLKQPAKYSMNDFYKKHKRLKAKSKNIEIERQNLFNKRKVLKNLLQIVKKAKDKGFLEALFTKGRKEAKKQDFSGVLSFDFADFKIRLGSNERANESLLKEARKDDLWLHLKDRKGPHVLIKANKIKMSEELIIFAAKLCVQFSKVQKGRYLVDYTTKKNVRVIERAFVNYVNYKSISVLKE